MRRRGTRKGREGRFLFHLVCEKGEGTILRKISSEEDGSSLFHSIQWGKKKDIYFNCV